MAKKKAATKKKAVEPDHPKYQFSTDWFSANIKHWEKHFAHLSELKTNILEIGAWEGRSTFWMLDNLCKHDRSKLLTIDPWPGKEGEARMQTFLHNLACCDCAAKAEYRRGTSWQVCRTLPLSSFDLIYVDGNHRAESVLEDAISCYRLLKQHGYLIFDDYLWAPDAEKHDKEFLEAYRAPKKGVDVFLDLFGKEFKTLHSGYQVILQKVI